MGYDINLLINITHFTHISPERLLFISFTFLAFFRVGVTRTSKPPCPAFKHFVTALSSTMSMIILQIKVGTAAGTYHHSAAAAAAAAAAAVAVAAVISLTQAPKACGAGGTNQVKHRATPK